EPFETAVHGEPHVGVVEALGQLGLSAAGRGGGTVVNVVADLGGVHDRVAHAGERARELPLAAAVAVGVGGVEKGDAAVVRVAQQRDGLVVAFPAPPVRGDGPEAESDFGDGNAGGGEDSMVHGGW